MDGTQDKEYNSGAFALADELFFFGGINGMNYFTPLKFNSQNFTPPKIGIGFYNPLVKGDKHFFSGMHFSKKISKSISYNTSDLLLWVSTPSSVDPRKPAIKVEIQGKVFIKSSNIFTIPDSLIKKSRWWWKDLSIHVSTANLDGNFGESESVIYLTKEPPLLMGFFPSWIGTTLIFILLIILIAAFFRRNKLRGRIRLLRDVGNLLSMAVSRTEIKKIIEENIGQQAEKILNSNVIGFGILEKEKNEINMFAVWEKGEEVTDLKYQTSDKRRPAIWCLDEEKVFDENRREIFTNQLGELYEEMEKERPEKVAGRKVGSMIYRNLELGAGDDREQIGVITIQNHKSYQYIPPYSLPFVEYLKSPYLLVRILMSKLDKAIFGDTMTESDLLKDLANSLTNALWRSEKDNELKIHELTSNQFQSAITAHFVGSTIEEIEIMLSERENFEAKFLQIINELKIHDLMNEQFRSAMTNHFVGSTIDEVKTILEDRLSTESKQHKKLNTEVSQYLESLSGLYKSFSDQSELSITIRDEWNLLQRYFHVRQKIYLKNYSFRLESNLIPYFKIAGNNLRYSDPIFDELTRKRIPQMLIQPFLENALRYAHGDQFSDEKFVVKINFRTLSDEYGKTYVLISIADNGIGIDRGIAIRKKPNKISRSFRNLENRLELLNRRQTLNKKRQLIASYKAIDLGGCTDKDLSTISDDDFPEFRRERSGTMVRIWLPWNQDY